MIARDTYQLVKEGTLEITGAGRRHLRLRYKLAPD